MHHFPIKYRFFSLLVCSLLSFSACSPVAKEDISAQDNKAYISITLQLPFSSSATRGNASTVANAQDGDTYAGNQFDRKVSSIRVVFYNTHNTVEQVFDALDNDVVGGSLNQSPITLRAKEIEKKQYYVLVLVNATNALKQATSLGQHKNKLEEVAQITLNDLVSPAGILMTATKLVPTKDQNFRFSPSEAEAASASLKVDLERSVAKVFLTPKSGGSIVAPNAANAQAQMVNFSLDVLNNRIFWLRKPALSLTGAGTATTAAPTQPETEATPWSMRYATDPNMSLLSGADLLQFSTLAPQRHKVSQGGWEDDQGLFAPENTMNAEAQYATQTTHAVICLRYVPRQLPELASAADRTWANYKGAILSLAQLKAKIQAATTAANDDALQMPAGFKIDAAKIKAAYPNLSATTPSFDKFNLKFYHNGENFYLHPLRHFSDQLQPMLNAYGRYGLVRNHLYHLKVTRVEGPGSPQPQQPEDKPNDQLKNQLSIQLLVQPWEVKQQNKLILQ